MDEKINSAIEIAEQIIRHINKPSNLSRRRDDWKFDTIIANLERQIKLLKGEKDATVNGTNSSTGRITSVDKDVQETS